MVTALEASITKLWNDGAGDFSCVSEAMAQLDSGKLRVAEKNDGRWIVHDYLKKAILLFFRYTKAEIMDGVGCKYFDKIPLKTKDWSAEQFSLAGFRLVPGAVVRYSAHIGKSAIVMQSFVNVGAFVDEGSMIDTNVLVGSCAQVGKRCHISDGVTLGGVLEPLQSLPVIVEDNCFIGVKSSLTEGVVVGTGAVLAAGTHITSSTRIIDRSSGAVSNGQIPPYSVVVPGTYSTGDTLAINCAIIVKYVTEQTREKTAINELLRL
ncbi:MAG: 2,3,4,5-tetrahydropyridine-2,6-dicarboxylate N-succinyltransferase [Holosporaceae bacterium]|jgi:2,3,4,5-tetrahydropyridine-2-carboxylate N-succinyltransferase|nr:2,3,4,5-tetrahydropyridine-2,6-dicarboxylate N-succinyltransferase [Holosporaceae bacterium]